MLVFLSGLGLGLSLIVAIGAQNVFVLRQGLRREHVLPVVVICALSDALLIAAGVAGLGFLVERAPWLIVAARLAGALFLLVYGLMAARRAWRGEDGLHADDTMHGEVAARADGTVADAGIGNGDSGIGKVDTGTMTRVPPKSRLAAVIATVLALTWLNPHVYLDTVLMLGSVASTHADARWVFAAGAMLASCLWFAGLGFGAGHLGRWLRTRRAWRMLDAGIAVVMVVLAVGLLLPVLAG